MSIRLVAALVILVPGLSCTGPDSSPDSVAGPVAIPRKSDATLLAGLNVSGPVDSVFIAGDARATVAPASYVSLLPGTFSEGTTATITNLRTAERFTAAIADGGFDPQPIHASLDDTMQVTVRRTGGKSDATAYMVVARAAPRIVRMRPSQHTDVPLTTVFAIVFSEPVNLASVNASSVILSDGSSLVPGEVRVLPATGYTVEFAPSASLAPLTTYTLTTSPAVTNLAGTSIGMSSGVTFTTAESPGSRSVASVKISPDSATVNAGGELQLKAMLTDSAGRTAVASYQSVTWTSSAPEVATVLGGGWVVGIGAGTAVITATTSYNGLTGTARVIVNPSALGAIATATCDDLVPLCGLYAVDPDGSNGRYLTSSYLDTDPVWSPDGTSIAFRSQRGCNHTTTRICHNDLYLMKAEGIRDDGSGLRSLTTGSGLDVGGMSWSPDGSRIVFAGAVFPTDLYPREALYVMNADGSGLRLLVSGPPGGSASWPDWSPDGTKIAYHVVSGDTSAINVVDADGSNIARISTPSASRGDFRPHWSPDGRRIAFTRNWYPPLNEGESQAFVMDADGSNVRQITQDGARYPVWSPDGSRFALLATGLGLGIMNVDGSGGRSVACCPNDAAPSWRHAAAPALSVSATSKGRP